MKSLMDQLLSQASKYVDSSSKSSPPERQTC